MKLPSLSMRIKFVPQDLWIGIYWRAEKCRVGNRCGRIWLLTLWVCIIPCLPIILCFNFLPKRTKAQASVASEPLSPSQILCSDHTQPPESRSEHSS